MPSLSQSEASPTLSSSLHSNASCACQSPLTLPREVCVQRGHCSLSWPSPLIAVIQMPLFPSLRHYCTQHSAVLRVRSRFLGWPRTNGSLEAKSLLCVATWPAALKPGFMLVLVRRASRFSSGNHFPVGPNCLSAESLWLGPSWEEGTDWGVRAGGLESSPEASCVAGPGGARRNGATAGEAGRERGRSQTRL